MKAQQHPLVQTGSDEMGEPICVSFNIDGLDPSPIPPAAQALGYRMDDVLVRCVVETLRQLRLPHAFSDDGPIGCEGFRRQVER